MTHEQQRRILREPSPPTPTLVLRGGRCVLPEGIVTTDIVVAGDRVIGFETAESQTALDGVRIIDARGALVVPGFVNAHSHSYGELCRHDGAGLPLEPWMNFALAGTLNRTDGEVYLSAALHAIEAIRTGTTTIVDHIGGSVSSLRGAARAYADVGIRSRIAPMIGDLRLPDTVGIGRDAWPTDAGADDRAFDVPAAKDSIAATLALRAEVADGALCDVILGPSAPQRVSPAMWEALAEVSRGSDIRMHTHLLETRLQAGLPAPGGAGWVAFLDSLGLLDERLTVAHAVWLTPDEVDLLSERNVTLVHNPQSNLQVGSGVGELTRWRRSGARIALGTDSVNCGGSMDMIGSMRLAALLHRPGNADHSTWETPRSVLNLATASGARALGIPAGTIEIGALADLAVFDMSGTVWATGDDPLASLVLDSYDHGARSVVVGGRVVLEDRAIVGVDEAALLGEVAAARSDLRSRNAGLRDLAERQRPTLSEAAQAAEPGRVLLPRDHPAAPGVEAARAL